MNEPQVMTAEDMTEALRAEGIRITRQRSAILRTLAESQDHPDATEVFRRASVIEPSVSLSTVYRTLNVLEKRGVVLRLSFEGTPSRFETADTPHHDHMIDIDTGDVIEFQSDKIEKLQTEIARELGYDLVYHKLELYGRRRKTGKA